MLSDPLSADSLSADPWRSEIRWLFQAAMLVFTMTVVIGILNGQQIVTAQDRDVRLAHVHSGTLGWITLSVLALCLWLFGTGDMSNTSRTFTRWLSVLAAISVPCYVLAFLSLDFGRGSAAAIIGGLIILVVGAVLYRVVDRIARA